MDSTRFGTGVSDGIPIALGYLTVSLAFGLYCAGGGIGTLAAGLISMTNMSSSGQFAGATVILSGGALIQLAFAIALVNLRYLLMSFSLSQRLAPDTGIGWRAVVGFGVTDEIYALAMRQPVVNHRYYVGLMTMPILGWTAGTVIGALVGEVLPTSVRSAFGVLLYAMFVAVVVPVARYSRPALIVIAVAALTSVTLRVVPLTSGLQPGWLIIISTLVAAGLGATLFPIEAVHEQTQEVPA